MTLAYRRALTGGAPANNAAPDGQSHRAARARSRRAGGRTPAPVPPPTVSDPRQRRIRLVLALVTAALFARLLFIIHRYGVDVFVWDQWDFLDALFHPRSLWTMFNWKHGPHRMGVG